jgi:HNH endonuclease
VSLGLPDRVEAKIQTEPNSGCWLWTGTLLNNGYGRLKANRRHVLAHRFVYEELIRKIPENLTLDHKCRIRCCVNPEHLEPVTGRINTLRGLSPPAKNASKSHCKNGHEFDEENTQLRDSGYRRCRHCHNSENTKYRSKRNQNV